MKDKLSSPSDSEVIADPIGTLSRLMNNGQSESGKKEFVINNLSLLWNRLSSVGFMRNDRNPRTVMVEDKTDEYYPTTIEGIFYVVTRYGNGEVFQRRFVDERENETT